VDSICALTAVGDYLRNSFLREPHFFKEAHFEKQCHFLREVQEFTVIRVGVMGPFSRMRQFVSQIGNGSREFFRFSD
jgi:hypothetical protein